MGDAMRKAKRRNKRDKQQANAGAGEENPDTHTPHRYFLGFLGFYVSTHVQYTCTYVRYFAVPGTRYRLVGT